MLREEAEPFVPAILLPFTGIEQQLTLVDYQEDRALLRRFGSKALPAVADQEVRSHFVIGTISKGCTFVHAQIYGEIADHRISQAGPILNCPGTMQTLAGAGSTAVQAYHISHRSLSASASGWSTDRTGPQPLTRLP